MTPPPLIPASRLPALALDPYYEPPTALAGSAVLLIDASAPDLQMSPLEERQLAAWLRRLPCVTLAIGAAQDCLAQWLADVDVRVATLEAAAPLLRSIAHSPQAATLLVQTLRLTEQLAIDAALVVESLAYGSLQAGAEFSRWTATHPPAPVSPDPERPALLLNRAGARLHLTLNRPERRNALSVELRDALCEALQLALADSSIESLTLQGAGACFSSGGDVAEFGLTRDPVHAHLIRRLRLPGALMAQCAARVTCYLHGACIGAGIELPAFAHHVVAQHDAWFQLPELRYGLIPGAGGCVSLPRRIGRQRTAWLALSQRRIQARTALAWGLVDELRE